MEFRGISETKVSVNTRPLEKEEKSGLRSLSRKMHVACVGKLMGLKQILQQWIHPKSESKKEVLLSAKLGIAGVSPGGVEMDSKSVGISKDQRQAINSYAKRILEHPSYSASSSRGYVSAKDLKETIKNLSKIIEDIKKKETLVEPEILKKLKEKKISLQLKLSAIDRTEKQVDVYYKQLNKTAVAEDLEKIRRQLKLPGKTPQEKASMLVAVQKLLERSSNLGEKTKAKIIENIMELYKDLNESEQKSGQGLLRVASDWNDNSVRSAIQSGDVGRLAKCISLQDKLSELRESSVNLESIKEGYSVLSGIGSYQSLDTMLEMQKSKGSYQCDVNISMEKMKELEVTLNQLVKTGLATSKNISFKIGPEGMQREVGKGLEFNLPGIGQIQVCTDQKSFRYAHTVRFCMASSERESAYQTLLRLSGRVGLSEVVSPQTQTDQELKHVCYAMKQCFPSGNIGVSGGVLKFDEFDSTNMLSVYKQLPEETRAVVDQYCKNIVDHVDGSGKMYSLNLEGRGEFELAGGQGFVHCLQAGDFSSVFPSVMKGGLKDSREMVVSGIARLSLEDIREKVGSNDDVFLRPLVREHMSSEQREGLSFNNIIGSKKDQRVIVCINTTLANRMTRNFKKHTWGTKNPKVTIRSWELIYDALGRDGLASAFKKIKSSLQKKLQNSPKLATGTISFKKIFQGLKAQYIKDAYRMTLPSLAKSISKLYQDHQKLNTEKAAIMSPEVTLEGGVESENFSEILVESDALKQKLIQSCIQRGVYDLNGRCLDEAIQVRASGRL